MVVILGYGSFTFQTMVHQDGVIKFLYKKVFTITIAYLALSFKF